MGHILHGGEKLCLKLFQFVCYSIALFTISGESELFYSIFYLSYPSSLLVEIQFSTRLNVPLSVSATQVYYWRQSCSPFLYAVEVTCNNVNIFSCLQLLRVFTCKQLFASKKKKKILHFLLCTICLETISTK